MDEDVTTIHITKPMSSSMIVELIDEYPNLEEITCSPSVFKRTSKTYIDALGQLDINVKIESRAGAMSKSNGLGFYISKLSKEGLSAKQISQKLEIPLIRVYYLLRKSKTIVNNRKHKYDYSEIKKLKQDGFSAKEISEKIDIPIRSVYHILNKDVIKIELPPKPIVNILKNAGAQSISDDAIAELKNVLTQEGNKISRKAIYFAHKEGKKTIKAKHIKLALK